MRTLAISDIHGCSIALETLLETVHLTPKDTLITLGDYIDKGPDSKGVLDKLINLYKNYRLIPLKGNHEIKMLQARQSDPDECFWLEFGGRETLNSYSKLGRKKTLANVPEEHWNFIQNLCVDYWQTDNHIFVHANLDPNLSLKRQSEYDLFWKKFNYQAPHYSGKTMICGHTSQKNGKPINLGHRICLDTWVCGDGWLTCLELESGKIWQANQRGQIQTAYINEFECNLLTAI
ncbi:metallophosphoesterase [Rippkaea orientalis PCC 8801]|uniref:Metallophosphoesterase n=1 Tax=Rippkaea orientalis (strain PCC 8801 / RF-1) TaxID=41431 RepID=B7K033_RIPO1|nr:metallophosphoesterase family protein [Rippkaea orientalis]ACK66180.1 metallophosphoesterase [Rippkaea orientalis PCC 8801]